MDKTLKHMDAVIYWLIVIIPFSVVISPAFPHSFIGLLCFLFLLKKIIKRQRLFIRTPVNLAYLLLILAGVLSFKNTISFPDSMHGLVRNLENGLFFLALAEEIRDKAHIRRIVLSLIAAATLASVDAAWQLMTGSDFIRGRQLIINIGLKRATAAFPNANVFGVYMSAVTPLILGLALFYFRGRRKFMMLAAAAIALFGLLSTFSRGSALGLYVGLLLIAFIRKSALGKLSLIALLFLAPLMLPSQIKDWAKSINYNPAVFLLNADRLSIFNNSLNMIRHHPVIGVGLNTYCSNYLTYKLPEAKGAESADHMYSHNNFLQAAAETGLVGLAALLYFLFALFRQAFRSAVRLGDGFLRAVSVCTGGALLSFLVNGLTETSLYYSRVAMIFWFLAGLSLSLGRIADEHQSR